MIILIPNVFQIFPGQRFHNAKWPTHQEALGEFEDKQTTGRDSSKDLEVQ